ncbi:hypothetical protein MLD52_18795 [Puniceicoccaceae bacterium K14]|nr:hypothetical protein [Puniceicoccaceae bacterium K14]
MRFYVEQWWFDSSAKALGEGYRDFTVPIGLVGTIREMNFEKLNPGDLAITASGIHVLVYLGESNWIQADPKIGRVVTLNGRIDANDWLDVPVKIYRWKILNTMNYPIGG